MKTVMKNDLRQALPPVKTYSGSKPNYCIEPEQEPVGFVTDSGASAYFLKGVNLDDDTPLYTAPPKREWVGLTEEELSLLWLEYHGDSCLADGRILNYEKTFEAKLKEKNNG